ncbi:NAD-dependent epimerase/dehydratase family protein [Desulfonatronum lacustre]|uniref:NAD-dependent epimerase/dehydratase family protein n=1 Tax=Desulfonatronum lacustre TaxID=66849 RepID=UPI00048BDC39|nr:NAD-dependent epimerase/dehydratase family protein [Desulfonatronum lacustre]
MDNICQIPPGTPVLVTGATGFTGIVLTRKLVEAGAKVSAVARSSSNLDPLKDLDVSWFMGEVFDERIIAQAMAGQEYVFHVAAAFRQARSSYQDYWNVHVGSTQVLAREALKNPHFKRFVHFSTIGVHGHIAEPPATEDAPFDPDDEYQQTKLEAELWLRAHAAEHKLPYTVIRPAAIYGPGDRRLLKLFRMALKPVFLLLGKGKCMYHLVHVDDLTNVSLVSATHPDALGQAFIAGAEEPIAVADIARIVAEHFGRKLRVVRLPISPFFLAADICERICRPLGIEPPLYRRRVAFYSKDRHFDVTKIKTMLGYAPRHANKDGILETARWYAEQGWLKA